MARTVELRKIAPDSFDALLKEIFYTKIFVSQKICETSLNFRARQLTLRNIGVKGGVLGCVQHKTHHLLDVSTTPDVLAYGNYSKLTSAADKLYRTKIISVDEYNQLIYFIDKDRNYFKAIFTAAKHTHAFVRKPLIDAADRDRSRRIAAENKKVVPSHKKIVKHLSKTVNSSNQTVNSDNNLIGVRRPKTDKTHLILQTEQVTDEMLLEYYKCFRKILHYTKEQAQEAAVKVEESDPARDPDSALSVYQCVFCTGYHIGHKPQSKSEAFSTVRNARKHWNSNVDKANAFVTHMSDTRLLKTK